MGTQGHMVNTGGLEVEPLPPIAQCLPSVGNSLSGFPGYLLALQIHMLWP